MKDGGLFKMTEDLARSEGMLQGWEEERRGKQSKRRLNKRERNSGNLGA